jgi:hypothetical protein
MRIINILGLFSLLALSGCVLSDDFSPPLDGKSVKVSVAKPSGIDILPMDVIYRSEKCRDKIFTSTGAISSRAGYHLLTVPFNREKKDDIVINAVELDGGGQCDWKLSNIRIQFKYQRMDKFGKNIIKSIPNDIVFTFDSNDPPRGDGHYDDVYGVINVEKEYYPMVKIKFTDDDMDVLNIQGQTMLTYRVHDATSINFTPVIHENMVVRVFSPKKKGDGYVIVYPNGDKLTDHSFPNSEKTKYDFVKQRAK